LTSSASYSSKYTRFIAVAEIILNPI